jgi:chromosome segregation ATPase
MNNIKLLQDKIDTYESQISKLKDFLTQKDEEIATLAKARDEMKSELEVAKGKISELESKTMEIDKLTSEVYDLKKTVSIKDNEINKLRVELDDLKPKIADLMEINEELKESVTELTKINDELKQSVVEAESKIKELKENLSEKTKKIDEQKAKLEKTEAELLELKPPEATQYASEERLICPNCGAVGRDIKSEEDKSKVLGYIGHTPMYAKKNVCKKCGYEF